MVVKSFQVKLDIQRAPKVGGKTDNRCASFIAFASMTYPLGSSCFELNLM